MSDVGQGSQPTSAAAPVQKDRLQKYLLFLKKGKRNHRTIIAARVCFVNELELILFA